MPIVGKKVFSEDEEDTEDNSKKIIKKRKKIKEQQQSSPEITNDTEGKGVKKEKEKRLKKPPKKKAPLDLDRQCGVLIPPNNIPCTRSLTCKIHAMGAKRSVEGRSQPYNDLLANYQKKSIGRPQDESSSQKSQQQQQQQQQQQPQPAVITVEESTSISEAIDSDEETENVRTAIERNRPSPLSQKQVFYVQRKRKCYKLRDVLLEAITPKTL